MSTVWGAWGEQWALQEKVSFDGTARKIVVHADVSALDIASDVYSAWVRWSSRERQFVPAMRYTGFDPIPGGRTGATFFMINGWKLVIDFNKVAVAGVLYSENYGSAYWSETDLPLYPATVSSLVNSAVSYQNVVTGTAATPEQIVAAVLAALQATAIPVNVKKINDTNLTGTGQAGSAWGPA